MIVQSKFGPSVARLCTASNIKRIKHPQCSLYPFSSLSLSFFFLPIPRVLQQMLLLINIFTSFISSGPWVVEPLILQGTVFCLMIIFLGFKAIHWAEIC